MGVTFHTSSNPRANLLSLPSALTAPHTGRAGRMLLAPASTFSHLIQPRGLLDVLVVLEL